MHPELSKRLVVSQIEEAIAQHDLSSDRVQLEEIGYPNFFVRFTNKHSATRLIRFECSNYDFQAVAIEPVDPTTREPLTAMAWMLRDGGNFPSHHMKGGGPFLCFQGTRDYYTHEGHRPNVTSERWEQWRNEFRIPDLIRFLKTKFASGSWE